MKIKLLSFAFMMLTASTMQSQDTIAEPSTAVALSLSKGDCPGPGLRPSSTSSEQPETLDTRPVSFPFWMVKAIALDLEEKSRLEEEVRLLGRELQNYQLLVAGLEANGQRKDLQLELSGKNVSRLELQLQAEKAGRPKVVFLQRVLEFLAALGTGFMLGRL